MIRALACVAGCALALGFGGASASAAQLRAGVATADITPPNGEKTLGFVRPDITVKGVHTRLQGRALVLDDGDTEVALLSTDVAFALQKDSLVARVKDLGFSHATILYTGTHTHSGPEDLSDWQVEQLANAIRRAKQSKIAVKAGWGTASVLDVNRNRSIEAHLANHGIEQFYGQGAADDDPKGVEHTRDTRLRLLRVDRLDGRPLAGWIHFPVHLTTSAPDVDIWDSDLAGAATHHLEHQVDVKGFVGLYTNGALGDLMPRFDSYNRLALMDLHGRRIAFQATRAWRAAGRRLRADPVVDLRWTRSCYCGQEIEPGRRVDSRPWWGLSFFGGSEDGASIFHEPASTEGRRHPEALNDPVQGRKIVTAPGIVHESIPEFHAIRIGNRLLLGTPGEPSVEMGRRLEAAVRPQLPRGVTDPVIVGLANDYMGYLTTPEEYQMQHYEGGHTVFGLWTSLLARDTLVALSGALATGKPAPEPASPPVLGDTAKGTPVGNGGVVGALVTGPAGPVERMRTVSVSWQGAAGGVDRPVDNAFVTLERNTRLGWRAVDSDLGLAFVWRETDGRYVARYEVSPSHPVGGYRLVVKSGAYSFATEPFDVVASSGLELRGVLARRAGRSTRLLVVAQNPAPDPDQAILWRSTTPARGVALLRLGRRRLRARWDPAEFAWVATVPGRVARGTRVAVQRLVDGYGNRLARGRVLRVGELAELDWPRNIGVGDGRTPGAFGEGQFPP